MESEKLYEITAYTENQVGLLSSVAGIFTRRSINIEKLLVYPSKIDGIHLFFNDAATTEKNARAVVLQMEKRVDVVRAFYQEDNERSFREIVSVGRFLKEREQTIKNR